MVRNLVSKLLDHAIVRQRSTMIAPSRTTPKHCNSNTFDRLSLRGRQIYVELTVLRDARCCPKETRPFATRDKVNSALGPVIHVRRSSRLVRHGSSTSSGVSDANELQLHDRVLTVYPSRRTQIKDYYIEVMSVQCARGNVKMLVEENRGSVTLICNVNQRAPCYLGASNRALLCRVYVV